MHERLVEGWLDSASERSYQAPFCQMLSGQGHRVVHSSRHSPIEFGKDIITVAPDGTPCAYQLKGNPGSRLTLIEFRAIEPQLLELVNLPIEDPSVPTTQHRSFLVTNGLVEDEVRLAITTLNRGFRRQGFPERRLEIIQRGDLLQMAQDLDYSLWPSELEQMNLLLETLVEDGHNPLPVPRFHKQLIELLRLDEHSSFTLRAAELRRRITSAAVLVSVALKNFENTDNHYAVISAWVLFCAYTIAACERFSLSFVQNAKAAVMLAMNTIRDSLVSLANEVLNRDVLIEGDPMVDSGVFKARYTLLLSLLSILWFWCEEEGWPTTLEKEKVELFLTRGKSNLYLWGEGAVPQFLSYYWYLRETDASSDVEVLLARMLAALVTTDSQGNPQGLPPPYYDFEEVSRHVLAPILGPEQDPLREEAFGTISFYAEALLHLLVRTGLKRTCKKLWPNLTRIHFVSFIPKSTWHYCLWRTDKGRHVDVQPPLTKNWNELIDEARRIDCKEIPTYMKENRYLNALFLILCPYRGIPAVIRSLARRFDSTWFIPPPIER